MLDINKINIIKNIINNYYEVDISTGENDLSFIKGYLESLLDSIIIISDYKNSVIEDKKILNE